MSAVRPLSGVVLAAVVVLAGCGNGRPASTLAGTTSTPSSTGTTVARPPETSPTLPFTTSTAATPTTRRATMGTSPTGQASVIVQLTLADNGRTVPLKVGDKVELTLVDQGTQWTAPAVTPPGRLQSNPSPEAPPQGRLAIWTAVSAGTVTVTSVGTAPCSAGVECPMFARLFTVTFAIS
jgi:hypothetical protein